VRNARNGRRMVSWVRYELLTAGKGQNESGKEWELLQINSRSAFIVITDIHLEEEKTIIGRDAYYWR
jgi:hypothetical protein